MLADSAHVPRGKLHEPIAWASQLPAWAPLRSVLPQKPLDHRASAEVSNRTEPSSRVGNIARGEAPHKEELRAP